MSYGDLYIFEYRDQLLPTYGRKTTVKIKQKDYIGSFEYIVAGSDPVKISMNSSDNYLFYPLLGMNCDLEIESDVSFKYLSLFTSDAYKFLVEIWKEPNPGETQILWWSGYLLPDQYSEPATFYENYMVNLTARDGIGALKDIDFVTDNKTRFVGKQRLIKIIAEVLKKTRLQLNINFAVNLQENNTPNGITPDKFENIFLDYAAFYRDDKSGEYVDCEKVLFQILQSLGARLVQSRGEWWITRVTQLQGTYNNFKYDYEGNFISADVKDAVLTYTGVSNITEDRIYWSDRQERLDIDPAYKKFVIHQDYGKLKSIIKNNDFELYSQIIYTGGTGTTTGDGRSYPGGIRTGTGLNVTIGISNWTLYPNSANYSEWPIIDSSNGTKSLKPKSIVGSTDIGDETLNSDLIEITLNSSKGLKISFDVSGFRCIFYFEIKFGDKWLKLDGTTSDTKYLISVSTLYDTNFITTTFNYFPADEITDLFQVKIHIASCSSADPGLLLPRGVAIAIDNINVDFIDTTGNLSYPEDIKYSISVNDDNNKIPSDIESIIGDLPGVTDNEDIYVGGYWYWDGSNYVPTSSWKTQGFTGSYTLMEILGESISDQYKTPKRKLSGILRGNIDYNHSILFPNIFNRKYLPIRIMNSDKYCKFDVEMLEIFPADDSGGRVLATENYELITTDAGELIKV